MYQMLTGYAQLLQDQAYPPLWMWIAAGAWAIGTVLVGFLFFISREREFAVRLT
jgi:teichoic acid transport system permease protein